MRRYLTSAAFLLVGLFVHFFVIGFAFTGVLLCAIGGVILCFAIFKSLLPRLPGLARFLKRLLTVCLCIALVAAIVTGIWIGINAKGADEPGNTYVIVLGAGVNGTVPSRPLRERLEAAKTYLESYPEATAILTGGKGNNENISEAQCMYNWLTERGIAPDRLRMEDKATSTEENLAFSLDLIEAETGKRPQAVTVISNEYHLARASIFAENEGVQMAGYAAKTQHPLELGNMFLREIVCVWYTLAMRLFA